MNPIEAELTRIVRANSGRILSALIKVTQDFTLAQDALQDAITQAIAQWPESGPPQNGGAWLYVAAKRRAIDLVRKESRHHADATQQILTDLQHDQDETAEWEQDIPDERLRLIFTCCHPALNVDAQVALTLRTLGGLTVREIARAFLASETTIGQRITRAKQKIKNANIPYEVPNHEDMQARRAGVLTTIYLIFNESYSAYEGQSLTREDLANEAIRLCAILNRLDPDPETAGLLCLMRLTHARRAARLDTEGDFVPLDKQDRSLWDQTEIEAAHAQLLDVFANGQFGPFQLQAAISALHCLAPSWAETDWQQIFALYGALAAYDPSPVVRLNQAVALANMGGHNKALEQLNTLEAELGNYQPFYAARADILSRCGEEKAAQIDYDRAIELSKNKVEKNFLFQKKSALAASLKNNK
ncbi:RNA polymerase sigma factor [Maritalea myrionectae]|uniref:RNA polymerase sigma factor n=1 Tax=Maritalea myrionectae TaxID=454601 RepID=UPI0003FEE9FD|nr:sigma-70 family RNA polymerase sigma factor [Maritalea myrionectae]